jgi:hypothetical protein
MKDQKQYYIHYSYPRHDSFQIHVASIFECIAYMNTLILGDRTDMTVDTSSTSVYNESNIMVPADYRSVSDTSVNETEIGGKQNNQNPNAVSI